MTNRYIYLAGPIMGCDESGANDWREYVKEKLKQINPQIKGVSPLRCEPKVGETYQIVYDDDKFGTERAISSKNTFDTQMADMVIAYLPRPDFENGKRESTGTILEVAWAHWEKKPVILVSNDPHYLQHPVLGACASWRLKTLDDAIKVIDGVLGVYA